VSTEDIIGILIPLTFVVMLVVERVRRAKELPKLPYWLLKGVVGFLLVGALNAAIPAGVTYVLGTHAPLHLGAIGVWPSAIVGILVVDFFNYWIHRTQHRFFFLWRWSHQWHHSAERMDLAGLSYQHPFDAISNMVMTATVVFLLGVTPAAGALIGFFQFLTALSGHLNIATPPIMGYFIARPEQHGLHHGRNVHAFNYAQLPIWDLLFRTWQNPPMGEFPESYGFWDGASSKMGAMLIGKDVGHP
jgi:sterol desaturase/sphingolipid hydroxylase (fatty acid hydroxylase superfamily)